MNFAPPVAALGLDRSQTCLEQMMKLTKIEKQAAAKRLSTWEHRFLLLCLPLLLGAVPGSAGAQGLSSRAVTIVVPYSPGTGPDVLARSIAEELQRRWNQTIVIDDKPGATGNIGTQIVARAAPDGHTLLMTSNPFTANVSLFSNVPYDPIKSFAPIIGLGTGALALSLHPSVPANNLKEFIAYARSHQGELNYGSPGTAQTGDPYRYQTCPLPRFGWRHPGHCRWPCHRRISLTEYCGAAGAKRFIAHCRDRQQAASTHRP
jgi:hypothetical protein